MGLSLYKKIKQRIFHKRKSPREIMVDSWYATGGDKTLRLNYELDENSIVFDVGGYEGQWASDIFSKYCCTIFIFEPIQSFAKKITGRFSANRRVTCYPYGLSKKTEEVSLSHIGDQSSSFKEGGNEELVRMVRISDFIQDKKIPRIDLIKLNIEGGEYDVLEDLIESGAVTRIKNIQVQFHDFVPNAIERMHSIQAALSKTHRLTYQYPFVWENWELL